MMIHAYREIHLNKVQSVLGDVFDYAINFCDVLPNDFVKLFLSSDISDKIQNGEVSYIKGKSGIEITLDIFEQTNKMLFEVKDYESYTRSKEYWIGWAVAYYQLYSNRKFHEIFQAISISELGKMYYTLHEADISKFVEILDQRIKSYFPNSVI